MPEIQNEESRSSNEENLHVGNSQEESNVAQTKEDMTTPPPTKSKKVFVSPKLKTVLKRAGDEDPRIGQAYTALQSALNRKKVNLTPMGSISQTSSDPWTNQLMPMSKKNLGK